MPGEGKFIDGLAVGDVLAERDVEVGRDLKKTFDSNHIREFFNINPLCVAKIGAGAAVGATGDENLMMLNDSVWEYHILGAGQTIVAPTMGTSGLDISLDAADNEGAEYCLGINAHNKGVFVVGTSPAFFAKMKFTIGDVSDTDDCAFGFRKVEAYQANIDDYDEMAVLNVISGNINIETILNGGATTTTDTTDDWADAGTHTLEILISAAGVVTYKIDGGDPTTTAAFTFDAGEVVVPFMYLLHAASSTAGVILHEFECGLQ